MYPSTGTRPHVLIVHTRPSHEPSRTIVKGTLEDFHPRTRQLLKEYKRTQLRVLVCSKRYGLNRESLKCYTCHHRIVSGRRSDDGS